ncbi:hypothetical protein K443DRAFT_642276 [Laccaria amethystina LaAM-08-1]|uniref:THUMP domain-containing protein n=1 Tax=Laccaria amethystina LaAM-08-1 TaxID=1095629 RepID=A0A0C9X965_9AGAR|nr:hypothetical protein K443DRAFT_642276 [Laccaria amethystina LaAM-08-1]
MPTSKRKAPSTDKRKKKYRSDGTPIWAKRHIDGPGVWVSCVKGKEKKTAGEIYDVFESIASEIWPISDANSGDADSDAESTNLSIEAQIANEVSAIKRPRTEQRFANCQTNTPCVIFISCKPPVDPVELVVKFIKSVETTGVSRTRYTHRLVPVSGNCVANLPEIDTLCRTVFQPFFDRHGERKFTYKIELRMRNHTTIPRQTLIQHVAQCIPEGHNVSLANPEIFILVEVFKSVCGVSIVEDYYRFQKFNVAEIASKKNMEKSDEGRAFQTTDSAARKEMAGITNDD